jgi:3-phenylpropionate/trans-cinnamate dioxygenase ferredoxin subunit
MSVSGSVSGKIMQVQLQRAARLADIEAGLPLAVTLADGRRICLVRDGNTVYAVADRCPHRDFALSGGDLVNPCVLECPWHGARFDVRTGQVLSGPATDDLPTYSVRVVGEEVFIGAQRNGG